MYRLKSFFNRNRKQILLAIIIIASIIILIQLLNYFTMRQIEEENSNNAINVNSSRNNSSTITISNTTTASKDSAISGGSVSTSTLQSDTEVIDQFIEYCNNGQIEEAYSMLTEDCKNQMYPNIEAFEESYYNNIFNGYRRTANIQNWTGSTYLVRMVEDMLSTGKYNNGEAIQDYITIESENREKKLNINNYIGNYEINDTIEEEGIEITVTSRDTYMDYKIYNLEVTNNTDKTILLDGLRDPKSIYIEDTNNVEYSSYNHELSEGELLVNNGSTQNISIRFYSSYVSTKTINTLVLSDVVTDYEEYNQTQDQDNYDNTIEIRVQV